MEADEEAVVVCNWIQLAVFTRLKGSDRKTALSSNGKRWEGSILSA
jgi:hypothetical protein